MGINTKILKSLNNNKTILYPTDTVWGIGCDATNFEAVSKIYRIKQREETKSLIILVSSIEMLGNYVEVIPELIIDFLKSNDEPVTVIYNNPKNLAENVIAKDNTIAIRIVKKGFVFDLIEAFEKPIVSTSANVSGEQTPKDFKSISKTIKENVDFIVSLPNISKSSKPSKIIRLVNNKIEILRE